eukprot:662799-Ditylum_brightwellii.AAC.1
MVAELGASGARESSWTLAFPYLGTLQRESRIQLAHHCCHLHPRVPLWAVQATHHARASAAPIAIEAEQTRTALALAPV